jgi:FAD dependent oxidoreductase
MAAPAVGARQPPRGVEPYDPRYDPLVAPTPDQGKAYAPTYWVASAGASPDDDGPVAQDFDADVVIIGSDATGISAALYLAQEHGIQAVVLEANQAAWGCSSRSGGQGQNARWRLNRSQWIARWGLDTAKQLDREIRTGFETFKQLTRQFVFCTSGIGCATNSSDHHIKR